MPAAAVVANTFVAYYEDAEKGERVARERGWDGTKGEMLDHIEHSDAHIAKEFATQPEAIAWLREQINADKSMFGCGDINEIKHVGRRERCRYCVCNGRLVVRSWIVEEEGITEERDLAQICAD